MDTTVVAKDHDGAVRKALKKARPSYLGYLIEVTKGKEASTYISSEALLKRLGLMGEN